MDKKKISTSQNLELKDTVAYLSDLLAAFKKGVITVSKGDEDLVLTPCSPVLLEIEAKKKKNKESFSFELSWHIMPEINEEEDEVLSISSELPPCCVSTKPEANCKDEEAAKAVAPTNMAGKVENKKEGNAPVVNPLKK